MGAKFRRVGIVASGSTAMDAAVILAEGEKRSARTSYIIRNILQFETIKKYSATLEKY